jgi:hypothetical protein
MCDTRDVLICGVCWKITGGRGSNFFLFVDKSTLAGSNSLEVKWISGKEGASSPPGLRFGGFFET